MSWPLSVKHAAKITFANLKCRTFQSIIYPAEKKHFIGMSSILAWGKSSVGLPPPFIAIHIVRHIVQSVRVKGNLLAPKCSETLIFSGSCVFLLPLPFELKFWFFDFELWDVTSSSNWRFHLEFCGRLWLHCWRLCGLLEWRRWIEVQIM